MHCLLRPLLYDLGSMNINFDTENLLPLLKDFYKLCGIKISVFDDSFYPVIEYPSEAAPFCANIRQHEEGLAACRACDKEACLRSKKLGKPHTYICHAGLHEAITPIHLGNVTVGYLILAQMSDGKESSWEEAIRLAEGFGVKEEDSRAALAKMKPVSDETIHSAMSIMDALGSYVCLKNLAQWKNDDIAGTISNFIQSNLDKKLSSESIAEQFSVSRSYLYKMAVKNYGCGINEYVQKSKMEKAKQMLSQGSSIGETANALGFADPSYFIKVFKKHFGITPLSLKKKGQSV